LTENAEKARNLIKNVVPTLSGRTVSCAAGCHTALDNALITAPDARDPKTVQKLNAIAGRVL
jgi:5'-methylthioadenosine phosphorylase